MRRVSRRRLALASRRWLRRKSAGRSRKRSNKNGGQDQCVGANPCDRGKSGVKKSLLVCLMPLLCIEGNGWTLAVCISGANTPDTKLLALTLDTIVVERPVPTEQESQHLCLDKDYDNPADEATCAQFGYTPHIAPIKPSTQRARRRTPPVVLSSSAHLPGCSAHLPACLAAGRFSFATISPQTL